MIDNKTWLEPADDAAYVNWGPAWRIPTQEQFDELLSNTNKAWTTLNGVHGWKFTSKTNSNIFVFLPAAGYFYNSSLYNAGSYGSYWSCSLYESSLDNARYLRFSTSDIYTNINSRFHGQSVRPVRLSE